MIFPQALKIIGLKLKSLLGYPLCITHKKNYHSLRIKRTMSISLSLCSITTVLNNLYELKHMILCICREKLKYHLQFIHLNKIYMFLHIFWSTLCLVCCQISIFEVDVLLSIFHWMYSWRYISFSLSLLRFQRSSTQG